MNGKDHDNDYGDVWRNWAGNLESWAEIQRPANLAEVQDLVRNRGGASIRCFGTGHSFSPLVRANGQILVDLSHYLEGGRKAWRWQKDGQNLVTFQPSAKWSDVREALTTKDPTLPRMYLSSTGALPIINASGFVAAGCHGTGWNQPTVSDYITAIKFVAADGKVHEFSDATTPNDMAAVRVNLGVLGIITEVTMRVEPMFNLHDDEIIKPTESVMGPNPAKTDGEINTTNLHKLITGNDYVELFWFPGSGFDGEIWVKQFNRTQDDPRDVPLRPDGWIDQFATSVMNWAAENPLAWSFILSTAWTTIRDRANAIQAKKDPQGKGGFVAEAPRVLFYADQAFPILDLEVAIPIPSTGPGTWDVRNVIEGWYAALNYAYKHQASFPLTTCLHARFTKTSQSLLSPAYSASLEDRVCWIEILSAYPKAQANPNKRNEAMGPHLAMINEVVPGWINKGKGRPHWAKNWQYVQPGVNMRALYPDANLQTFNALRRTLDPGGVFVNSFLSQQNLFF
jgi:hypothetical protein